LIATQPCGLGGRIGGEADRHLRQLDRRGVAVVGPLLSWSRSPWPRRRAGTALSRPAARRWSPCPRSQHTLAGLFAQHWPRRHRDTVGSRQLEI